ncbi:bcl-2-like protein 15 [Conger conger]|uniref:bcl-2-like protein 15 n=1 Tax=Conger conger TaxID=82655 RepID=UPI002A5AE7F4|nr:bcl-2-like protein 15 [Conger conger]
MAPKDIVEQTYEIIDCFFDPSSKSSDIETDCSVGDDDDSFDPCEIAGKLREIGDEFDEQTIHQFKKALENDSNQVEAAFTKTAEALSNTWMAERGEVAMEKHLLRASVTLGLYVQRNYPKMASAVQVAMTAFLISRVAPWVSQQGGWERVASE